MPQLQDYPPLKSKPDVAQLDWRSGPCAITKESEALELANFDFMWDELCKVDANLLDFELISWGHWACGWVCEMFFRPGSAAEEFAEECRRRLISSPVLDSSLHADYLRNTTPTPTKKDGK